MTVYVSQVKEKSQLQCPSLMYWDVVMEQNADHLDVMEDNLVLNGNGLLIPVLFRVVSMEKISIVIAILCLNAIIMMRYLRFKVVIQ